MADGSNTKFDMNNPDVRYAKGGKVIAYKTDEAKFKKIGITDKYTIEAINEIGLQGLKFNAETVNKKIEDAFLELLGETKNDKFLISEDSEAITKVIQREIETRYEQGDTDENIARFKSFLENSFERMRFVKQYAETQKQTISEWANYFSHSEYPIPFKYLMLKAVTGYNYDYKLNELIKRSNKTTRNFTPFDAGSLAELYASNSDNLLKDFTQIEANNANKIANQKLLLQTSSGGKWLKFNGGSNTPEEERIQNSKELSKLVQNTYWCTKTNSKSQLDGGDFYVYVTQSSEGEPLPRIAVRMEGDKVAEVRGNKSGAQDIEDEMLPIAEDFLKNNIENNSGKKWLDSIKYNQKALALFNKLQDGLFKGAVEEFAYLAGKEQQFLLDYANRNGHIVRIKNLIKSYLDKPNKFYGKNEVKFPTSNYYGEPNDYDLDNDTRILIGDVSFSANVDSTKNLEIISGTAIFKYSAITNLGKIKLIGGDADFRDSDVNDLGDLTEIGATAYFTDSDIRNLSNLERIGNRANFYYSNLEDLGKLIEIGGNADFSDTPLTSLFELTYIGGKADFRGSKITDLGKLKFVGENLLVRNSEIVNLGNLEYIGGEVYFARSEVFDLGKLKHIGGDAWFENSQILSLKNLEYIGGIGFFTNSKVSNLGNLKRIMGDAEFPSSQITNLENLEYIGGDANFDTSLITSLGNLEYIGGNATFVSSLLTNLGKLKYVGKDAFFTWSKITDIGNLKVGGHIHGLKQKFAKGGKVKKADFLNGDFWKTRVPFMKDFKAFVKDTRRDIFLTMQMSESVDFTYKLVGKDDIFELTMMYFINFYATKYSPDEDRTFYSFKVDPTIAVRNIKSISGEEVPEFIKHIFRLATNMSTEKIFGNLQFYKQGEEQLSEAEINEAVSFVNEKFFALEQMLENFGAEIKFEKGGSLLDTKIEKTPLKGKTLSDVYDLPELYELAEKYKMGLDTIRKEYLKGIEVEREHTNDYGLSAQIALNHLNEDSKYYTKLKKAKLERGGKVLKITKFTPITFNN
jgi:hypothetical protein